jgi:cellulose synthase/poly-beta-1,6-N-acetylglucosamine synthase-like glycosyltransferase
MTFHPDFADAPKPLVTPEPQAPGVEVPNRGQATPVHGAASDAILGHWSAAQSVEYFILIALSVVIVAVAIHGLSAMLHAWRSTSPLDEGGFSAQPRSPRHSFTLLVPVRHEGHALTKTLDDLAQQDHPDFSVVVIVGDDDPSTELIAREAAAFYPGVIEVVLDENQVKNKPTALNRGFEFARGTVIGVFDSGDRVHPSLLRLVDARISETGADVVQAGVQTMNLRSSWSSLRSVLDNYFLFRSRLQQQAKSRAVPLADNSVFVVRNWLEWAGGWDTKSVAENFELGVRLSTAGAKVVIAYSPDVVTRAVTPVGLGSLFAERSRRDLGALQVLGKGSWRRLPTARRRLSARYRLMEPFLQSASVVLIPILIIAGLVFAVPVGVALILLAPLAIAIVTLAVEVAGLGEFGTIYAQKVRARDYLVLILGAIPFSVVLAAASLNALITSTEDDYSLEPTAEHGELRANQPNHDTEAAL